MKHPKYDLILAAASGEQQMQVLGRSEWVDCNHSEALWYLAENRAEVRIKPNTIRIGDVDVPAPVTEPLEMGQGYWWWNMDGSLVLSSWSNDDYDTGRLKHRLIHLTESAARENMAAVIKALGGEV